MLEGFNALARLLRVPRVSRGGVQVAPLGGDECLASFQPSRGAHAADAINVRGELGHDRSRLVDPSELEKGFDVVRRRGERGRIAYSRSGDKRPENVVRRSGISKRQLEESKRALRVPESSA